MNTRALEHFLKVVEHGSLSQAAIVLGVDQSIVSRSIRDLEASLGATLLYRDGRGAKPTEIGRRVLDSAQDVLSAVDAIRSDIAEMERAQFRGAVIGMLPTATRILAVPLIASLRATYPVANLHIVEGSSGHLLEWLADGRLDLAVMNDSPAARRFNPEPVLRQQLHLVGARSAAQLPPEVQFRDLANYPLILSSRSHGTRRDIDVLAQQHRVKLNVIMDSDSLTAALQLVAAGYGWSILPAFIAKGGFEAASLQSALIVAPTVEREIILATPLKRPAAARMPELIRTFKKEIRTIYDRHNQ